MTKALLSEPSVLNEDSCRVSARRVRLIPAIRILSYHSIGKPETPLTVDERSFERHIELVASAYSVVKLGQIVDHVVEGASLPSNAVAVTFDDGYRDNLTRAFPILLKYGVPATIFVATGFVGSSIPLYTEMLPALSWAQIREMSESGMIDFGAHTRTHVRLSDVPRWVAKRAVNDSKLDLEEHLGRSVQIFSYPQGRFNSGVIRILQETGFRGACGGAGTTHRLTSPFRLRRLQVGAGKVGDDVEGMLKRADNWSLRLPLDAIRRAFDLHNRVVEPQ